ncbi:MAG: ABC transporter ATP-binding protein [Xanthomonadales bacterium]|nr:ABC transporter ATP-binding protein [Xanthomonadales bacterium]
MIETEELCKRYGDFTAVDSISFKVEPGEVLGFLGPNGAGKSTSMKMIAGFLAPTSGTARVCGFDVQEQSIEARRIVGYLPEGAPSYGEMTPRQFLQFVANVRGLSRAQTAQRIDVVIARLHLDEVLEQPIDTLSKGFKRRVGLAQAILHDPKVLILDEPTDGLDPNQKHEVRDLIRSLSRDKIVVISTHILEEVHAVCSRAIIISRGKLLADATPAELESRSRYHKAVSFTMPNPALMRDELRRMDGVADVEINELDGRMTVFPRAGAALFERVSDFLRERKAEFSELQLEQGRLDEVFRQVTTQVATTGERA